MHCALEFGPVSDDLRYFGPVCDLLNLQELVDDYFSDFHEPAPDAGGADAEK